MLAGKLAGKFLKANINILAGKNAKPFFPEVHTSYAHTYSIHIYLGVTPVDLMFE